MGEKGINLSMLNKAGELLFGLVRPERKREGKGQWGYQYKRGGRATGCLVTEMRFPVLGCGDKKGQAHHEKVRTILEKHPKYVHTSI